MSWLVGVVFAVLAAAVSHLLWKVLRTPVETDKGKLYLGALPLPRWRIKKSAKRVLLLTYGTRGDVQPLVVLAKHLSSHSYQVAICTCDSFEEFVTRQHGCEFISCGVREVAQPASLKRSQTFAQVINVFGKVYGDLSAGMYQACVQFEPDLIIAPALVRGIAAQCAEKLEVPFWSVHFAPSNTPTFEFPPPGFSPQRWGVFNKLLYVVRNLEIAHACVACGLSTTDQQFRVHTLQLPPLPVGDLLGDVEREPQLHAYSPALCPRPLDWPQWNVLCGALMVEEDKDREALSPQVLEFIRQAGTDAIVYVGLGSMENVQELVGELVVRLEAILLGGGGGRVIVSSLTMASTATRLAIADAPHRELFKHCALVIHHGGAGTTHAAMECGVPQLVFPILQWSDQPFWADQVEKQGVGFHCRQNGDQQAFTRRVTDCLFGEVKLRARALQSTAVGPDGKLAIAALVDEYFQST